MIRLRNPEMGYTVNPRGRRPCRVRNPLTGNSEIHDKAERLGQTNPSWCRCRDLVASMLVFGLVIW